MTRDPAPNQNEPLRPPSPAAGDGEHRGPSAGGRAPQPASLAATLRAVGSEVGDRRIRRAMFGLAAALERNESLDAALPAVASQLPGHILYLIRRSATDARAESLLADFVYRERDRAALSRELLFALGYPLAVILLAVGVTVLVPSLFMREMLELYKEFGLKIPQSLYVTAWVGRWGPTFLLASLIALAIVLTVLWLGLGSLRLRSMLHGVPLLGPVWRWLELARWSRAVQLMLEVAVPLPEALRTAADSAADWTIAMTSRTAAEQIEAGRSLADSLAEHAIWPHSALVFVQWGEQNRCLPQALEGMARICDERARQRGDWFRVAFPPFVFLLIAHCVVFSYASVLIPMVNLISKLS